MINVRGDSLLYTCISFFWFHWDVMINVGHNSTLLALSSVA